MSIEAYYSGLENMNKAEWISRQISACLPMYYGSSNRIAITAYLLYKASRNPEKSTWPSVLEEVNEGIRCMAESFLSETKWEKLLLLLERHTAEDFAQTVCYPSNGMNKDASNTPDSILRLAKKILCIEKDDRVANICCGNGKFMVAAATDCPAAQYYGYDIRAEDCAVAQSRVDVLGIHGKIEICDAFSLAEETKKQSFNKVFSNYPLGLTKRKLGKGAEYLAQLTDKYPGLSKATSSDWVFNALLCECLSADGKAIGIMTNGSTWNSIDKPVRQYFVEKKLIECVIALPEKLFPSTPMATTMIIFSHSNESVRMIDASRICQKGRRQNEFRAEDIETIMLAMQKDSKYSRDITFDELRGNEYTLNLSRYLQSSYKTQNGEPFENIIKSIRRGAPCSAKQLDEMVSHEVTNMQYLMLANIKNGMIEENLPYLSEIPKKYEKYCLKNNDLILSKNGAPYKVAVASIKDGQKVLANGNLYIIELNQEKANPVYVKSFFESEQGIAMLKSITVGSTMPNIGIEKLKSVDIPLPSLEEQNKIAEQYQTILDEISVLKLRLDRALSKLQHVFEERWD